MRQLANLNTFTLEIQSEWSFLIFIVTVRARSLLSQLYAYGRKTFVAASLLQRVFYLEYVNSASV